VLRGRAEACHHKHETRSDPDGSAPIGKFPPPSAGRRQGDVDERCSAAVDRDVTGLGSHRTVVWVDVAC